MLAVSFNPFPLLSTERLLLRQMNDSDASQLLKLRSDKITMQYLDKPPMQSLAEASLLITKINGDVSSDDGITWGIVLNDNPGLLIGTIGFWRITKEHYRAEIGYMLLPEYFNKGYMTEALKMAIDFGFNTMNLHSIEANINPGNVASEALLKSAGFVQEAYYRENFYFDGIFKDSAVYSLLNN